MATPLFQDWPAARLDAALVPTQDDQWRACIETALGSDNPTVVAALSQLFVLVRLAEPAAFAGRVAELTVLSYVAENHAQRINPFEAHRMIERVLGGRDCHAVLALDNFIEVARSHWSRHSVAKPRPAATA